MLSFEEGFAKICGLARPLSCEVVEIGDAFGRVLRESVIASRPQPASDISAMDGYALVGEMESWRIIGEIAAGSHPELTLKQGEAVRIFTGASVPKGADRVLIQENAQVEGDKLWGEIPNQGANIRKKGADFSEGFSLDAPQFLSSGAIALAAALNTNRLTVTRKARVAILPTGSELVEPSLAREPHHVVSSNPYGLKAIAKRMGASVDILPIQNDDLKVITDALLATQQYDLVITSGGASVGDFDLVPDAAKAAGFTLELHKIAMRPGKPVLAGRRGDTVLLGLPGNPVSAMVTGEIFISGLLRVMSGLPAAFPTLHSGILTHDLAENGERKHFLRAQITRHDHENHVTVFDNQDSAMLSILAKSNGLVVREANAPALKCGYHVKCLDVKEMI